jgi:hypothetical protein
MNKRITGAAVVFCTAILITALAACPDPGGSTEPRSSDATLKDLVISKGTLSPPFDPAATAYAATVTNAVEEISLEGKPNHPAALVEGTGSHSLLVGENPIAITVTAEDGSKKVYTLAVTRSEPHEDPEPLPDPDNLTWIVADQDIFTGSEIARAVSWGAEKFVATGTGGKMAWSADGLTWTPVPDSSFGTSNIVGIVWNGAQFVATGANGKIARSSDGISWTAVSIPAEAGNTAITCVVWNGERFVAGNFYGILYSEDGETWTFIPKGTNPGENQFPGPISAIAWSGTRFVAGTRQQNLVYSSDGLTWALSVRPEGSIPKSALFSFIYGVAWGDDKFVAVGKGESMAFSADGETWNRVEDSPFGTVDVNAVVWANGTFIAVGNGAMASSRDGETWTLLTAAPVADLYAIAWGAGKYVIAGKSVLACSGVGE